MYKVDFKKIPGDACTVTRGGVEAKGTILQCILAADGEKLYFVSIPGQIGRAFAESEIDVEDETPEDEDFDPDLGEEPAAPKPQAKNAKKKNAKKKK